MTRAQKRGSGLKTLPHDVPVEFKTLPTADQFQEGRVSAPRYKCLVTSLSRAEPLRSWLLKLLRQQWQKEGFPSSFSCR